MTKEELEVKKLLEKTAGKFFYAEFIKRTNGELRKMIARLHVSRHVRGGKLPYDRDEKGVVVVFDMAKKDYRVINLSGLKYQNVVI